MSSFCVRDLRYRIWCAKQPADFVRRFGNRGYVISPQSKRNPLYSWVVSRALVYELELASADPKIESQRCSGSSPEIPLSDF